MLPLAISKGLALRRHFLDPASLFAVFALVFGLLLSASIPPLGGGNETFNFGRVAAVAYGKLLVGDVPVPGGIVDLINLGNSRYTEGVALPIGQNGEAFRSFAALDLRAENPRILSANPISVLNPIAYLPQAVALRIGAALGARPLTLFYLTRLSGLVSAVGLTFLAIRIFPTHRYSLAAVALLPPFAFARSTVDADQLTNALAFLFAAVALRAAIAPGLLSKRRALLIAVLAFAACQCKSAYLLLPFLLLSVPSSRFANSYQRLAWLMLAIIPGLIASLGYMIALRLSFFDAIQYQTWAGQAYPSKQLSSLLHDPLNFAVILLRTLFLTPILGRSIIEMLGVFGPPIQFAAPVLAVIAIGLGLVMVSDKAGSDTAYGRRTYVLAAALIAASVTIVLTLLYVQWNAYGSKVVVGFQGRYLYPVAPLLVIMLRTTRDNILGLGVSALLGGFATFALGTTFWMTLATYYG